METRTYNVYKFDELPQESKDKVLENYRDINTDYKWYDMTFVEWQGKLNLLGYDEVEINFSGFWSQGDGASFTAKNIDLLKWLKAHKRVGHYKKLIKDIEAGAVWASVNRLTHHYYHAYTCRVSVDCDSSVEIAGEELMNKLAEEIEAERVELSKQLYKQLEKEYEYLTSDEAVIDTIKSNDYDFTLAGKID